MKNSTPLYFTTNYIKRINTLRLNVTAVPVFEVADAEELIKNVMHAKWDVIISDLSMPGRSGLDALQQIKLSHPGLPVLILSIHPEEQYALRALKSGASGYLSKDAAPDELVKAVKKVVRDPKPDINHD